MSGIGDAMNRLFVGDGHSFFDRLNVLKREYGTVTATAEALGVDRRTIQRWESGAIANPKPDKVATVDEKFRAVIARNQPAPADNAVSVKFNQTNRNGSNRSRDVSGTQLRLEPGTMERVRQEYIAAGPEAAGAVFVDGINDTFYHGIFYDDLMGTQEISDATSDASPTSIRVS